MAKTKPGLPDSIKVGAMVYSFQNKDEYLLGRNLIGVTDYDILIMGILSSLALSKRQDVTLHEVLHAINQAYLSGASLTEDQLDGLASGLMQVLQDNPELVRFILAKE